jgi:riboflavin synthase alpha subunit
VVDVLHGPPAGPYLVDNGLDHVDGVSLTVVEARDDGSPSA